MCPTAPTNESWTLLGSLPPRTLPERSIRDPVVAVKTTGVKEATIVARIGTTHPRTRSQRCPKRPQPQAPWLPSLFTRDCRHFHTNHSQCKGSANSDTFIT